MSRFGAILVTGKERKARHEKVEDSTKIKMLGAPHRCSLALFALLRPVSTQDNVYCIFTAKFVGLCANKQRLLCPRVSSCTNALWLLIEGGEKISFYLC
jgi:hypothetical protein